MSWSDDLPAVALTEKLTRLAEPVQEAPAQTTVVEGGLRVTWRKQRLNPETGNIVFSGGVRAQYGPTTIEAQELELWNEETRGEARGEVVVSDPEGELRGSRFRFNWKERSGDAENVSIIVNRVRVRARSIKITEGKWLLQDFSLTTSKARRPDLAVAGREMELVPGKSGRIRSPRVTILGQKIPLPFTLPFALDRRVEGLRLPTVGFRKGDGVGLTWFSGIILSERTYAPDRRGPLGANQLTTTLSADFGIFPTAYPTYSATLVTSTVKPSPESGLVRPLSDLDERFRLSPMESVLTRGFPSEERPFRNNRYTAALGFAYNQQTTLRRNDSDEVSRRAELTLEHAQRFGAAGWMNQLRLHDIRVENEANFRPRAMLTSGFVSGARKLGPFQARLRADLMTSTGAGTTGFGWARLAPTLSLPFGNGLTISGQYVGATEFGTPAFDMDRLYVRHGWSARADYKLGPTTAALLYKYDFDRRKWIDTEFQLAWVAGSYEPFIASRLNPRTFVFGVRVRFEDISRRLSSRSVERGK